MHRLGYKDKELIAEDASPVNVIMLMNGFNGKDSLPYIESCLIFSKSILAHEECHHITTR